MAKKDLLSYEYKNYEVLFERTKDMYGKNCVRATIFKGDIGKKTFLCDNKKKCIIRARYLIDDDIKYPIKSKYKE